MSSLAALPGAKASAGPRKRADGSFYLGVALAVALVVAIGFGRTVNENLFHPALPPSPILYVHVAMFTAWVLLFIAQTALIRSHRVAWHRRLGIAGVILGGLMPVIGIATALSISRQHHILNSPKITAHDERFLIVSFFDMTAFAVTFWLAIWWRRRPEIHRRLMLMASCGLTVAAFARFPHWMMPHNAWYVFVDLLILAAIARDWIVTRRVHPVYRYGLPALALGQATAMWIYLSGAPAWVAIAHAMLR